MNVKDLADVSRQHRDKSERPYAAGESRAIAGTIVRFTPERTSDLRRFIAQ
jgi:hypothetical protein